MAQKGDRMDHPAYGNHKARKLEIVAIGKHVDPLGRQDIPSDAKEGYIPLYLEGRTVIGKAWIKGNCIEMQVEDENVLELLGHNLIGLNALRMGEKPEPFIEEITIKEKTDEQ